VTSKGDQLLIDYVAKKIEKFDFPYKGRITSYNAWSDKTCSRGRLTLFGGPTIVSYFLKGVDGWIGGWKTGSVNGPADFSVEVSKLK
jgi:hypothetical protein